MAEAKPAQTSAKPAEGTVVSFADKFEVKATKTSKHLKAGKVYVVTKIHGDFLIKSGLAEKV